jgi:hypothetical protein
MLPESAVEVKSVLTHVESLTAVSTPRRNEQRVTFTSKLFALCMATLTPSPVSDAAMPGDRWRLRGRPR